MDCTDVEVTHGWQEEDGGVDMRELLWLLNWGHSTVVCHLSLSIKWSLKLVFRGFLEPGMCLLSGWYCVAVSGWLEKTWLPTRSFERTSMNRLAPSFSFIHPTSVVIICCLIIYWVQFLYSSIILVQDIMCVRHWGAACALEWTSL